MNHHPIHPRSRRPGAGSLALGAALLAALAGCGGHDDDVAPVPVTNGSLSAQQIGTAQGSVETAIFVVDAGASAPTATQIDRQRAALDGSTTDGAATIAANQTALDAAADVTPAF